MTRLSLPISVSNKKLEMSEIPSLAIVESVLMHLNSKKLLVGLVKIDYTDQISDYDPEYILEE